MSSMLRRTFVKFGQRRKRPDAARLLYGKKKNVVHRASDAKPSVATMLGQVSSEQLPAAVERAILARELGREEITALIKQHRALRRMDRTEIVLRALRNAKQPLTAQQYCLLMAHANDERKTYKALAFWQEAVKEGKSDERLHGTLLATYKNAGNWRKALDHCDAMWEDKMVLDPFALHSVMNNCRRNGPWESGLAVFSKAVTHKTKPNTVVYLELLRLIRQSHLASRWQHSLAILQALERMDLTAGHYNAVIATLGGRQWERGVALFNKMQERSIQPSVETLPTVLALHSHNIAHCVRCIATSHALGMPVTDAMYRAVFSNLFEADLQHEAMQFAEKEYKRDTVDAGNPVSASLAISVGMMDALLSHPRPQDALLVYEAYEKRLGEVTSATTRNLGTMGDTSQRWLVQGRVAVVDHNVLLSPRFESLIHHYDSVFIPFTSVRLLVRRIAEQRDSVQSRYAKNLLRRLGSYMGKPEWSMIRVLPLAHQLHAHTYLRSEAPTSPEALTALRAEANRVEGGPSPYVRQLLERLKSSSEEGGAETSTEALQIVLQQGSSMAIRGHGTSIIQQQTSQGDVVAQENDVASASVPLSSVLLSNDRITAVERVTAVAGMLKSLNTDTDIHVLWTNGKVQQESVARWNQHRPLAPLISVQFPQELEQYAPPALPPGKN